MANKTVIVFIAGKTIRRDGYTKDGTYYGTPGKVYEFYSPDCRIKGAVRADNITNAKTAIKNEYLNHSYWFRDEQRYHQVSKITFER